MKRLKCPSTFFFLNENTLSLERKTVFGLGDTYPLLILFRRFQLYFGQE